jgi:FKBP-type peptidyl-prolyl cis-trans isomerase
LGAGQIIPGLDMGILGMRVGEKRRLTIPAVLGYGSRGRQQGSQQIVPPHATLVFEVELLEVLGKH